MFDRLRCVPLIALVGCASPSGTEPLTISEARALPIRFMAEPDAVLVFAGNEWFTQFHYGSVTKPFLHPILAPSGDPVTRGWPVDDTNADETHDHAHHTSCWFAHGDVNGHDFWHGSKAGPRIFAGGFPELDERTRTIRSRHEWIVGRHDIVCVEDRTMRFAANEYDRVIDLSITLTAVSGPVVFGDTKEGTFALRMAPTLRVDGDVAAGTLRNSEGQSGSACWGQRARWLVCSGPVGAADETVSVILFDHPSNPRHPTWWHARTYGLLAANPFGVRDFEGAPAGTGDLRLDAGASITFRYRVQVRRGSVSHEVCQRLFDGFVDSKT